MRHGRSIGTAAGLVVAALLLAGCSAVSTALDPGSTPKDADGRPIAPGPATPSACITPPFASGSTPPSCVPVHNPPSQRYVEQAIPNLLPTRGYGSIEHVRCSGRIPPAPTDVDPHGLYEFSHWTCVGQEPEGTYLHQDVIWTPASGYLTLNAVTRDRSPALTVPRPNDPGLPNPHASEGTPTPAATLSQRELAAH